MQQRIILLEIDELIDPDNPALEGQRNSIVYEIQQSIKPPMLTGETSQLKAIRQSYFKNKMALQMEHIPITDQTASMEFWQYLTALDEKYRRSIPHEPTQ